MTDNPILRDEVLGRFSISAPRPVPTAHTRLVFVDSRGQLHAPLGPLTLGETVWRGLCRVYEVDMAEHAAECQFKLPCREKGFSFDADLRFAWRVHLPERIVQDGRTDVAPLYTWHLRSCLLEHSEEYGLEERETAQRALGAKLADQMMLAEGITILRCTLTLSLGTEAERYLADRTRALYAKEALGRARRAQLEEDEFRRERMRRYKEAIASGDTSLVLMLLDHNPGDVKEVIKLILEQRDATFDKSRDLVTLLRDEGLLDKAELDEATEQARRNLVDALNPRAFDTLVTGTAPALDSSPAGRDAITEGRLVDDEDEEDDD